MYDLRFVLSPYVCMQDISNPALYVFCISIPTYILFFLYGGPKYVGSQVCTQSLRMYLGFTNSFSVRFFLYGGPKYVGSQVCTESLRMYVGYTNSCSVRFFVHNVRTRDSTTYSQFLKIFDRPPVGHDVTINHQPQ